MENKVSLWILGKPVTTSRIESQSISIMTSMDTWQRDAD